MSAELVYAYDLENMTETTEPISFDRIELLILRDLMFLRLNPQETWYAGETENVDEVCDSISLKIGKAINKARGMKLEFEEEKS